MKLLNQFTNDKLYQGDIVKTLQSGEYSDIPVGTVGMIAGYDAYDNTYKVVNANSWDTYHRDSLELLLNSTGEPQKNTHDVSAVISINKKELDTLTKLLTTIPVNLMIGCSVMPKSTINPTSEEVSKLVVDLNQINAEINT